MFPDPSYVPDAVPFRLPGVVHDPENEPPPLSLMFRSNAYEIVLVPCVPLSVPM